MKLAEALLLRADRNRTLAQLTQRIQGSARYQEGEKPPEDAQELVRGASALLDELEGLIRNLNRDPHTHTIHPMVPDIQRKPLP